MSGNASGWASILHLRAMLWPAVHAGLIALALLAPPKALSQPAGATLAYARSSALLVAQDAADMQVLLDSLHRLRGRSADDRILHDLLLARWYRHTKRKFDAHHIFDTIRIDTASQHPWFSWLRSYQHAKTLKDMELFAPARARAVEAGLYAARSSMADAAFEMELLVGEIDLDDGRYQEAMASLTELHARARERGLNEGVCRALIALGNVHYYQENDIAAARYYRQALDAARTHGDPGLTHSALLNLGAAMSYTEGPQAAIALYRSILDTTKLPLSAGQRADLLTNMASMYSDLGDHRRAVVEIDRALDAHSTARDTAGMAHANLFKATALWALGQRKTALEQVMLCRQRTRDRDLLARASRKTAEYLHAMGRDAEAYAMLMDHAQLNDSLARDKYGAGVATAQVRFETAAKEHRIAEQQQALTLAAAEDRRKNIQRIALILAVLASVIIATVLARSLRHRRRLTVQERALHEKQVDDLLQQQEIKAMHAMLEGQEKERGRVAQDLHDRLGAMLSTIKMQVGALQDKVELVRDDQRAQYGKVTGLLDEAVSEVRRISYDMVTVTLSRFGLAKAIEDLCESVRVHGKLDVELKLFGLDQRMERSMEIATYRIMQELIGNVLKHANARELSVSVTRVPGHLSIMVSDDGKGFDTTTLHHGIGLDNVRSRATAIGATVRIDSTLGHGTTVSVEGAMVP